MKRQVAKNKWTILLLIVFFVCVCAMLGGICTTKASAETASATYSYKKLNDSECSVRLLDKTVTKAIIPETAIIDGKEYTVVEIGSNGFLNASNVEKVRLPKTVKKIGRGAFANCKNLSNITLNAVEEIEANAFALTAMEYIIIPDTVVKVGANILRNANTKVYVRETLFDGNSIPAGWDANWNTYNSNQDVEFGSTYQPDVKYVHVSEYLESQGIMPYASTPQGYIVEDFQEFCSVKDDYLVVNIPAVHNNEPVVGIANSAFYDNTIVSLTIEYAEDAINIGPEAFFLLDCQQIVVNRNVTFVDEDQDNGISYGVFAGSSASSIFLPSSLNIIVDQMFDSCENLKNIFFVEPTSELDLTGVASTSVVELPSTITTIGNEAFCGTTQIEKIKIPDSVVNVGASVFVGWNKNQIIEIDYENRNSLPKYNESDGTGWSEQWDESCPFESIIYSKTTIYSINYYLDGGVNGNSLSEFTRYDEVLLKDATKIGYKFEGWFDNAKFEGQKITQISRGTEKDIDLYAKFEPIKYRIVYEKNQPNSMYTITGNTSDSEHFYDKSRPLTTNGYQLVGWNFICWCDDQGNSYPNGITVTNLTSTNDSVIHLYAQWEQRSYRVLYVNNKPNNATSLMTGTDLMTEDTYLFEENVKFKKNYFAMTGWNFVGWNTSSLGNGKSYVDEATIPNDLKEYGTVLLYAQWEQKSYTVVFRSNKPNGASGEIFGSMAQLVCQYEDSLTIPNNGYSLQGWNFINWISADGKAYNSSQIVNVREMKTNGDFIYFSAEWERKEYTITYNSNQPQMASNIVSGNTRLSMHHYDEESLLSANGYSLIGWHFVGWNTRADGRGESFSDKQAVSTILKDGDNVDLYAQWRANVYYINPIPNYPNPISTVICSMGRLAFSYDDPLGYSLDRVFELSSWKMTHWTTELNGGTRYDIGQHVNNLTAVNEATINLYAQWTEKPLVDCKTEDDEYDIATINQFRELRQYATKGWKFNVLRDFDVGQWSAIPQFDGELNFHGHTLTYFGSQGFIDTNNGTIFDARFKPTITVTLQGVTLMGRSAVANYNYGKIWCVDVLSTVGSNAYMNSSGTKADIVCVQKYYSLGALAGLNYGEVIECNNYASLGTGCFTGGIVGLNMENAVIEDCNNYGNIYYNMIQNGTVHIGGIVATVRDGGRVVGCRNYGDINFALHSASDRRSVQYIANIIGSRCSTSTYYNCYSIGKVTIASEVKIIANAEQLDGVKTNGYDVANVF